MFNLLLWLVEAIMHLSHQVHRVEHKLDVLLRNSKVDFSREDKGVLEMTKTVKEALGRVPRPDDNNPTKGK